MRRELVELALAQAGIIDDDRRDAKLTSVTLQELEFQRSGGYDILYPELKWAKLIPVDTSVPAGADTIAYEQWAARTICRSPMRPRRNSATARSSWAPPTR